MIGTLIYMIKLNKLLIVYYYSDNMPPRRRPPRPGKRAVSAGKQDIPNIESVKEQTVVSSPLRVRRRVEIEAKLIYVIRNLQQEMTELRTDNRSLRNEMHQDRQQVPPPVPPAPIP